MHVQLVVVTSLYFKFLMFIHLYIFLFMCFLSDGVLFLFFSLSVPDYSICLCVLSFVRARLMIIIFTYLVCLQVIS